MEQVYISKSLERAKICPEYLHTNSTTHNFLFGAIAELVDNSKDANSNEIHIFSERREDLRGGFTLNILDDGEGMDPNEVADVIVFGKSSKKLNDSTKIGQYGNGLKSGSMRLGNDVIIFTKKNSLATILLLSNTFLRSENVKDEILVPLPSFNEHDMSPWYPYGSDLQTAVEKHKLEMELILKYSPFNTKEELFKQFDLLSSASGTLVVIFNLKLIDEEPELDIRTDKHDILLTNYVPDYEKKLRDEYWSLRAYLSVLYYKPKMKIYIQGKKVRTKFFERNLFKAARYEYATRAFKEKATKRHQEAETQVKIAENFLKEKTSSYEHAKICATNGRCERSEVNKKRREKELAEDELEAKKKYCQLQKNLITESKKIEFIFGLNLQNKFADGLFIYDNGRLIIMYEQAKKKQKEKSNFAGIVGLVNLPFHTLEAAHNKQHFYKQDEQNKLITLMTEHMGYYLDEIDKCNLSPQFWKKYGYLDNSKELPEGNEYYRRRVQDSSFYIQCDKCLQWRCLHWNEKRFMNPLFPADNWNCDISHDFSRNSCSIPEAFIEIPLLKIPKNKKDDEARPSGSSKSTLTITNQKKIAKELNNVTLSSDSEASTPSSSQKSTYKSSFLNISNKHKEPPTTPTTTNKLKQVDNAAEKKPNKKPVNNSNEEIYVIDDDDDDDSESKLVDKARTSRSVTRESIDRSKMSSCSSRRSSTAKESEQELPKAKKHKIVSQNESDEDEIRKKIQALEKSCDDYKILISLMGEMVDQEFITKTIQSLRPEEIADFENTTYMNNFDIECQKFSKKKQERDLLNDKNKIFTKLKEKLGENSAQKVIDKVFNNN